MCRWFCHFDDDMYVNVPQLVDALHEFTVKTSNKSGGDFYLGRWPIKAIVNPKLKNGYVVIRTPCVA